MLYAGSVLVVVSGLAVVSGQAAVSGAGISFQAETLFETILLNGCLLHSGHTTQDRMWYIIKFSK